MRIRPEQRIAIIYMVCAGLWILLSDNLLDALFGGTPHLLTRLQSVKGLLFVSVTGLLLYIVMRGEIVARERAQQTLEKMNAQLAQQIDQRTHELVTARDDMQRSTRMKSRFVTDIIHSLRTPITAINMRLEMLEKVPEQEYARHLDGLKRQADQMNALIVDVLDLIYLEEQGTTTESAPVDFNAVIGQVVEAHREVAEGAGLTLSFTPAAHLPPVMGNSSHLGQMVANLVANAIKYTPTGSVHLTTTHDAPKGRVILVVEDTGMGIDKDDLPHLFERFYRSRSASKARIPGTGLGLGIVREVLDLYDGEIEVTSTPGKGSVFTLWLPAVPD